MYDKLPAAAWVTIPVSNSSATVNADLNLNIQLTASGNVLSEIRAMNVIQDRGDYLCNLAYQVLKDPGSEIIAKDLR